ncbi:MAG: UDP-N-acetylmuramate dehydrogenase [Candidatus Doudnabacteria bacterium]|nr:UDP-N-acetylmuramate dehydrogenase [Candidatus Doudnabacteria bacterium]
MNIHSSILLAPYTTFKIGGPAKFFCEIKDQFDALTAFEFAKKENLSVFVLGGGSNLLVSDRGFNGLVIRVVNRGVEVIKQDNSGVSIRVASGENWDEFVSFCVKNGWWGLENLSHIPGSTGAIAVQNVGAYGQEAKNVIDSVTVFDTATNQILSFKNSDCGFAYRTSIFNTSQKGRYIIFDIIFKLKKTEAPILSYKDLAEWFENKFPDLEKIRNAVIQIRDRKFPFPTEAKKGNAGSFFKNLQLNAEQYGILKEAVVREFSLEAWEKLDTKVFKEGSLYKIPTAFLLELCGLKGVEIGGACINANQPLVIVNKTGEATSSDVVEVAKTVLNTLKSRLGVCVNIEPELLGFSQSELRDLGRVL